MKAIPYVRDVTGKLIRLGMFDTVEGIAADENSITLTISSAKFRTLHEGRPTESYHVTKRGMILYRFTRDESTGVWILADTVPVWWSTDERHGHCPRQQDHEWADLCHRPGTERSPMDNLDRIAQGYTK